MKRFIFLFLLFFTCSSFAQDKTLVMVVDLVRHGDRGPLKNFGAFAEKEWSTAEVGALTKIGEKGSYIKGQKLGKYYINQTHLISSTPSSKDLYVASSEMQRTIETSKNALRGMLGSYANKVQIDVIPNSSKLLRTPKSREGLSEQIFAGLPPKLKSECLEIKDYLNKTFNLGLQDTIDVLNFGDLLLINRIHHKKFPENRISKDRTDRIIELREKLYLHRTTVGEFICVASGPLLSHIDEMFMKRINNESSLKLALFFASDNNILSALRLLDRPNPPTVPQYNSDLRFELYQNAKGTYFIKVLFDDHVVPVCNSDYCEYKEFSKS